MERFKGRAEVVLVSLLFFAAIPFLVLIRVLKGLSLGLWDGWKYAGYALKVWAEEASEEWYR
jgi:hypothetical protein